MRRTISTKNCIKHIRMFIILTPNFYSSLYSSKEYERITNGNKKIFDGLIIIIG